MEEASRRIRQHLFQRGGAAAAHARGPRESGWDPESNGQDTTGKLHGPDHRREKRAGSNAAFRAPAAARSDTGRISLSNQFVDMPGGLARARSDTNPQQHERQNRPDPPTQTLKKHTAGRQTKLVAASLRAARLRLRQLEASAKSARQRAIAARGRPEHARLRRTRFGPQKRLDRLLRSCGGEKNPRRPPAARSGSGRGPRAAAAGEQARARRRTVRLLGVGKRGGRGRATTAAVADARLVPRGCSGADGGRARRRPLRTRRCAAARLVAARRSSTRGRTSPRSSPASAASSTSAARARSGTAKAARSAHGTSRWPRFARSTHSCGTCWAPCANAGSRSVTATTSARRCRASPTSRTLRPRISNFGRPRRNRTRTGSIRTSSPRARRRGSSPPAGSAREQRAGDEPAAGRPNPGSAATTARAWWRTARGPRHGPRRKPPSRIRRGSGGRVPDEDLWHGVDQRGRPGGPRGRNLRRRLRRGRATVCSSAARASVDPRARTVRGGDGGSARPRPKPLGARSLV